MPSTQAAAADRLHNRGYDDNRHHRREGVAERGDVQTGIEQKNQSHSDRGSLFGLQLLFQMADCFFKDAVTPFCIFGEASFYPDVGGEAFVVDILSVLN